MKLLNTVDECRNARTSWTLGLLLDRYLQTLGISRSTHRMQACYLE